MSKNKSNRSKRFISYTVIFMTTIYPLHPAWGNIITPADKNTQVSQQKNIPIINIAMPNSLGVSHNKYQDFNVDKQGAVLNNSTDNVNSSLVGQVKVNTNLKEKSADLIINEVLGNGRSQLQGKLEVVGKQANVVIANPNGITCDGCSFINTPAITLTTGKPIIDKNGAFSSIEIKKGSIVIGAQGMNAEAQSYADIISRATELNGQIKAQNLTLMQGANRVDLQKGTVIPISSEGVKPTISVDTKALGGMYANQVKLVSTEAGVGVNLSNIQTTQNNLTLTVDGKITVNGNIQSTNEINISSKDLQINHNAKLNAQNDITLATNILVNNGQIIAGKDLRVFADTVKNTGNNALIQAESNLWIQKNAVGDLSTLIENKSGTIKTNTGDLVIRTKKLDNERNAFKIEANNNEVAVETKYIDFNGNPTSNAFIISYSLSYVLGQFEYESIKLKSQHLLKWFDVIDSRTFSDTSPFDIYSFNFNTERQKYIISQNDNIALITSGKNLYINANQLNNKSKLSAKENAILTGLNFINSSTSIGYDKKFDHYKNMRDTLSFDPERIAEKDMTKLSTKYLWHESEVTGGSLVAGMNLVMDFKGNIVFSKNHPVPNKIFSEKWLSNQDIIATADDILINAGEIKLTGSMDARNNLSLISIGDIKLQEGKIKANKSLSIIGNNNLDIKNAQLTSKDLSLLIKGNLSISDNSDVNVYRNEVRVIPILSGADSVTVNTGGDLKLENTILSKSKNYNIYSDGNTFITNDIRILDSDTYYNNSGIKINKPSNAFLNWNSDVITLTTKNDLLLKGINLNGNSIALNSGRDITLSSTIEDVDQLLYYEKNNIKSIGLVSNLSANENITIYSGRDLIIKSINVNSKDKISILSGRDLNLNSTAYSAIANPLDSFQDKHYIVTSLSGDKGVTLASNGAITAQGSSIKSLGDILISSSGDIRLESVKTHYRKQEGKRLEDLSRQIGTEINSGRNLTVVSEGSILFQASHLITKGIINIAAKGGYLYAQAMEETSYYEEKNKKCNKWTLCITKKEVTKIRGDATNKVTEFTAGGDINLLAKDDVTLEASKINTEKNAKITSQTGKVNFKAVKNTTFEQDISNSTSFYITHRNKGFNDEKWQLPTLHMGGELTIDAAKGINADIKANNTQDLDLVLNLLGTKEETKWLAGLKEQKDVQWNLVKDAYDSWDYKSQHLNPLASALIMVTVTALTSGSGTAAWAGDSAVSLTGTTGASAAFAYGAGYGGINALAAQAAVAFVENKGDVSKTLRKLGESDTVKSILVQMVISGALNGLDVKMEWTSGTGAESTLPLLSNGNWNQVAQRVAAQSVVSSTLNTAFNGGSFTDNFQNALLSSVANQFNAEGAKLIGDHGEILGHAGKALSHAVVSGISAEISGGDVKGAVVGALAAELAAISLGDNLIDAKQWQRKSEIQAQVAKVLGGFAGAVFTGEPGGVYSGANAAENTFRFNYLSHHQRELMEKELAAESSSFKKAAIHLKWIGIDLGQDASFAAGMLAGLPAGLYDTVEGLANLISNPKETYAAIRVMLKSDDKLGLMTDAVKQSYITRLDRMEAEYQKAGTDGSFNSGVESGKLIFDIVGTFAGGAGTAKYGVKFVDKVSAKLSSNPVSPASSAAWKTTNTNLHVDGFLSNAKVKEILSLPHGQRPDPSTYMSKAEIDIHLAKFDDGAVRFASKSKYEQYDTYGLHDAFVMSKSGFEQVISTSQGNLRVIEQKLGFNKGDLSNSDIIIVRIEKKDISGLKIPSGNEAGVNNHWLPGGYTSGGIAEATMNFANKPEVTILELEALKK